MSTYKPGEFILNSIHSSTLGDSRIQLRPDIAVPTRKTQFVSVQGVDGDYLIDEEAYENTSLQLEIICKASSEEEVSGLRENIAAAFQSSGYIPLIMYFDPDWIYYVKTVTGPTFRLNGQWPTIVAYQVDLSVKPLKESSTGYSVTKNTAHTLVNPSRYASRPVYTLNGTGDMVLTLNGETYGFTGVDSHIVVNSKIEQAYKVSGATILNRNNKMLTRKFPILMPGSNTMSTTGATTYKIEGRWVTLVS